MQYLKRQNRQSVLAVDIPGNFNQFYRQDPRVEMYLSISVYIDVYTGTEMFGLEWTKGWLMEIWAECDSRSAKSVNRRGRKYRFWNTQRSIEVSLEYSLRGALQMRLTAPSGMYLSFAPIRRPLNSFVACKRKMFPKRGIRRGTVHRKIFHFMDLLRSFNRRNVSCLHIHLPKNFHAYAARNTLEDALTFAFEISSSPAQSCVRH